MPYLQKIYLEGGEIDFKEGAPRKLAPYVAQSAEGLAALKREYDQFHPPYLGLAASDDDLRPLEELAADLTAEFSTFVMFGTGGSSLGGRAICGLAGPPQLPPDNGPKLHFVDNLSASVMTALFKTLDLGATHFIVASKSGYTPETLTQLYIASERVRRELGETALPHHFTAISDKTDNPLRRFAAQYGIRVLDHPHDVVGRFSALSCVGLLPALIAGLDARRIRSGALAVMNGAFSANEVETIHAVAGAAFGEFLYRECGVNIRVLMPYDPRLEPFALWHRQLVAESLGKESTGMTPMSALGPVDQHSQLQLYVDGPADKFFTIIMERAWGEGQEISPEVAADPEIRFLGGHTVGDLVAAEAFGTRDTLIAHKRPVRTLELKKLDEPTIGALIMHFFLEVVITAKMRGVNPFDQPAVDEGKRRTREYLERHSPPGDTALVRPEPAT